MKTEQLLQQLAAKDELHAAALQVLQRHHQEQLTAAVEELEAIAQDETIGSYAACDIATAALAKLGHGK